MVFVEILNRHQLIRCLYQILIKMCLLVVARAQKWAKKAKKAKKFAVP